VSNSRSLIPIADAPPSGDTAANKPM